MNAICRNAAKAGAAICFAASLVDAQAALRSTPNGKTTTSAVQNTTSANPHVTLFGGLATGDGAYDIGPSLAASFNWRLNQLPVNFRLDPYFAYHTANDPDGSATFLGASANAEIAFRTEGTSEPYLFGGVGLYYNSLSIELPGGGDADNSGVDAGFGLGGGVRFGGFTVEAKMRDINEFTTVSFLLGFMLGGR